MALSRIKTNSIADSAITGAKISDGTVVASDIAALSVTPEKLANTVDFVINGLTVGKGGGAVAYNTALGLNTLSSNTTGGDITAIGGQALKSNTTGIINSALGVNALYTNTTGGYDTALGHSALFSNTTGSNNTSVGTQSLYSNTTASNNTAVGYQAGYSNTTGANLTAIGRLAGYSSNANDSTFVGVQAGYSTTGTANSFFGINAGYSVTSGTKNTIIGSYNGNQGGLDIRTASNYIVLSDGDGNPRGWFDGGSFVVGATSASDSISAGFKITLNGGAATAVTATHNTAVAYSTYHVYNLNATNNGYRFYVNVNGGIANYSGNNTNLSDARTKTNVELAGNYLDKVCSIPVKLFNYKDEPQGEQQTLGVIAQDVESIAPELVNNDGFGKTKEGEAPLKSIYTTDMMFALMKAIQELKAEVDSLKQQLAGK